VLQNIQNAITGVVMLASIAISTTKDLSQEYLKPPVWPLNGPVAIVEAQTRQVEAETKQNYTKPELEALLLKETKAQGVSYETAHNIITCESNWNPEVQSNYFYKVDRPDWGILAGERELSFGLVQIHLSSHRNITKEQALDPIFSIKFLVNEMAKGNQKIWTCATQ